MAIYVDTAVERRGKGELCRLGTDDTSEKGRRKLQNLADNLGFHSMDEPFNVFRINNRARVGALILGAISIDSIEFDGRCYHMSEIDTALAQ